MAGNSAGRSVRPLFEDGFKTRGLGRRQAHAKGQPPKVGGVAQVAPPAEFK